MPWETRHFYSMLQECVSKSYWKFRNSVPAIPTFILIFLFWWRETWQRNENFDWSFLVTNGEKLKTTSTFLQIEKLLPKKKLCRMRMGKILILQKYLYVEMLFSPILSLFETMFSFWERIKNWFWRKYWKRKLFSVAICYSAPNKPEAYLEPGRTSTVELFRKK